MNARLPLASDRACRRAAAVLVLALAMAGGCGLRTQAAPALGAGRILEPGVRFHEVTLSGGARPSKVWVYLPEKPASGKLPVVLVAPAGTRMFHGMALADGDRPEHLPYVRAGFAVVAYELDGALGENPSDGELVQAARAFKEADAGVADAKGALDYALAQVPRIDAARVYTSGHSSAATTSLLVAANEPRVKACVAFAPVVNVRAHLGNEAVSELDSAVPGYAEFLTRYSPSSVVERLRCPVFLFHADDDSNVPVRASAQFAERLSKTNAQVRFVRVPTGNHYDSMIRQGIPQAIRWLKSLPASGTPR